MNQLPVTLLFAISPPIILISYITAKSTERKPVFIAFVLGYFVPVPALILELVIPESKGAGNLVSSALRSFLVVGLIEESAKLLLIVVIITRFAKQSKLQLRLFIAAAGALGFAAFENILYIGEAFQTILLRGGTALPLHVATALIMTAIVFQDGRSDKKYAVALMTGVAIHGVYDLFLAFSNQLSYISLAIVGISVLISIRIISDARHAQ